jgi:muramoyltetrapeptide carboxypeptidase
VALIAPASPPPDPDSVDRAIAILEALGLKPVPGKHVRSRHGFLAGNDRDRAGDLMRAFQDRRIRAVFCLRGGYGCARILPRVDFTAIRKNPKILVGHSDITALHCAIQRHCGLVTFHGPMLNSEIGHPDTPTYTHRRLFDLLTSAEAGGNIGVTSLHSTIDGSHPSSACVRRPPAPVTVHRGRARGRLAGGNLSVLCSLVGTPWMPDLAGRIVILEEIGEAPYRIDRMLTQLLQAGCLDAAAGFAIGTHHNCLDPLAARSGEYRQTVEEVFRERLKPLKVPIVMGLPFGHVPHNATLPHGIQAELDAASSPSLSLIEPAVI